MAATADAGTKQRSRPWTETELKCFAFVLTDEENDFGYKLDTLALKKTANKSVFEDVKKVLEERMSTEEFKEENEREHRSKSKKDLIPLKIDVEKLRNKFKWMKDQWRKYTDRIKKGSGKASIQEPEWYAIINPIFSDTHGNMELSSKASDVLSDDYSDTGSEEEQTDATHSSSYAEEAGESDLTSTSDSGTENATRKAVKIALDVKPLDRKKRIRSQSQAINEIAKSFHSFGESQQKRCERMMEADKERHAEFLAFQKEQAELNRQHELKMLEIIMKHSSVPPQRVQPHPQQQVMSVQSLVPPPQYYSSIPSPYSHTPPTHQGLTKGDQDTNILDMDNHNLQNDQSSMAMTWY